MSFSPVVAGTGPPEGFWGLSRSWIRVIMLFCRLLPTVFLLLSASVLTPAVAARDATAAEVHSAEPHQDQAGGQQGHVDSGAFLTAVVATHNGDDLDAARAFRAAAAADPSNKDLVKQAFVRSVMAGDPEAVPLAHLNAALPGGQTIISSLVLGNDAAVRGDWPAASRYYQQAGADPMAHLIMPMLQAWCHQAQGQADEAIAALTHIQGSVLVPFYTLHAALIAQVAQKKAQAGDLFALSARMMPGYDLLLTRSYAAWFWAQGEQTKARNLLRSMLEADPVLGLAGTQLQASISHFPVASPQQGVARAYVLTAFLLRQQSLQQSRQSAAGQENRPMPNDHQFDEASRLMLGFALGLDPHLAEARLMLAEIQDDEGHQTAARETLLRIPQTDPLAPVAAFRLALADGSTGNLDEAREKLNRLVQESPNLILPVRALGNTLSAQKDWKGAIAAYTQAIALATPKKAVDWSLLFLRSMAYHEMGDWPHAKADLKAALVLAPDEPVLLNSLGYSMAERKEDLPEAEKLLRRAIALSPQDAAIRDSLGWVRVEQGDLKEGIMLLEQAAEQTPEDPEVNYHLGEAYWRAGRHSEAVDQWNVALGLKPEPGDEALIRAALARAAASGDKKAEQIQHASPAKADAPAGQPGGKQTP
ncbi:tetratricopeptide repeat protein [Acetobacter senegalensis]|uniref:tetratricopeptide repeat protein n=1 Tax=Acetobacter senegalensis TaxID=446692 RepID=UPI0020A1E62F|nr:tetratricopeptide repeat protein [Acetobacter senegalensis]MCP1195958.1 tetratricopeptide repeat protein [Acetobacter senegalensis]